MKESEIRIGNYYKYPNSKPFIIEMGDLENSSFILEDMDIIEGVLVNEEILLGAGFIKIPDGNFKFPQIAGVDILVQKDFDSISIDGIHFCVCQHLYLHQLQNFVSALFNEELKFKTATLQCKKL